MQKIKLDEYGEFLACPENIESVVDKLLATGSVLIGWSDGEATHYDVLLNYIVDFYPENRVSFQRGIHYNDLFVSVIGRGAFGFDIEEDCYLSPYYFEEKMNIDSPELAAFISDVITNIYQKEHHSH